MKAATIHLRRFTSYRKWQVSGKICRSAIDPAASNKVLFGVVNDSEAPKEKWLVQMVRPAEDGSVLIECVNYADEIYDADDATAAGGVMEM